MLSSNTKSLKWELKSVHSASEALYKLQFNLRVVYRYIRTSFTTHIDSSASHHPPRHRFSFFIYFMTVGWLPKAIWTSQNRAVHGIYNLVGLDTAFSVKELAIRQWENLPWRSGIVNASGTSIYWNHSAGSHSFIIRLLHCSTDKWYVCYMGLKNICLLNSCVIYHRAAYL